MSFILDQLKKSGRKRQIELEMRKALKASGHNPHERPIDNKVQSPAFKKQTMLYLVLAVLLLNGSLFVWWLYPRVFEKTGRSEQPAYRLKPAPAAPGPEKGGHSEQMSRPFVALPDAKSVLREKQASETKELSESLSVAGTAKPPVLNKKSPGPLSAGMAGAAGRSYQNSGRTPGGKKIQDTALTDTDNKTTLRNPQIETRTGATKYIDEKNKILDLQDLPVSLSKKLPELRISSHLYSNDRKSRLVSINGRIMQEGYNMSDGLYLEEITRDGVILDYHGYRFHKKVD